MNFRGAELTKVRAFEPKYLLRAASSVSPITCKKVPVSNDVLLNIHMKETTQATTRNVCSAHANLVPQVQIL